MEEKLEILKKRIRHSNPSFTMYSLRRTVETVIIEVDNLFFMDTVDSDKIDEMIKAIPADWKIEDRIRDYKGELC